MKVADLAHELRCSVKEIQFAARRLEIAARHGDHALSHADCSRIRDHLSRERAAGGSVDHARLVDAGVAVRAPGTPDAAILPFALHARDLPRAAVRREPAAARDEGAAALFVHPEFLEWLHSPTTDVRQQRRARLVLWQFFSRGQPNNVKSLTGPGRGWLRTRLGGVGGNQFYLWWTPSGAPPVAEAPLPRGAVLLRAVLHHEHNDALLEAGDPAAWLRLHVRDVFERHADLMAPFTETQAQVASAASAVRLIRGHPGTGKTTALWLSTAFAEGSRALYITYGRRLAAESEQHFRALGPQGLHIDVLTFEELLSEFGAASNESRPASRWLPPDQAAERMRVLLGGYQQRRAPWEDHEAELYAELHAHFVGRALPIPFRNLPRASGPTLGAGDYVRERGEVLGTAAARAAASIGEHLRRGNALRELMPGPLRARAALDALGAGKPVPARFQQLDWIFVDEVQDLTLVESLLLVELAARLGREQGRLPGFVAAGDEGQTVRPTDFEWGPLADLLNERLGARQEHELPGNLRSPRNIATVINRSWGLYRQLDKAERPRGYAEAEVEETAPGRIIYCRSRTPEEDRELIAAFARTPGSALVHPGYRVPEAWQRAAAEMDGEPGPASDRSERPNRIDRIEGAVELWTSDAAKGLDFQVVGVLDAGRQLERLHALAEQAGEDGRIFALWARALADQLRVALSRATDTLVLVDREDAEDEREAGSDRGGPTSDGKARIFELCHGADGAPLDGFLEEMEPRELAELLAREDADAHSLVAGYLAEIPKLLQDRPSVALRQARHASGLLGSERSPGSVLDPKLRRDVYRLRGVAALLVATDPATVEGEHAERFRESNTWLHKAELPRAATAALQLRDLRRAHRKEGEAGQDAALKLAASLEKLQDEIPEAGAVFRLGIVDWCRASASAAPPAGIAAKRHFADAVRDLALQLGARHPELVQHRETVRRRVAQALFADGYARESLQQYEQLAERDPAAEARCLEVMADFTRAAERYEQAGDPRSALRCARLIPDVERALRLAVATGAVEDEASLTWLRAARELVASGRDKVTLTPDEIASLLNLLEGTIHFSETRAVRPARRARPRKGSE